MTMINVLRAEALKIRSHRATWLMVWIFPILFGLALVFQIGRDLLYGPAAAGQGITATAWLQQSTSAWRVPLDGSGRFIIAGFAALVFAGEYGWNTWKLVVPVRARWQLVVGKWCTAAGFVFFALGVSSLIGLVGSAVQGLLGSTGIPAGVTLAAIVKAQAMAAGDAILPLLYTVAWAGFFAVLTGSLLAAVGSSIVVIVLEQALLPVGLLLHGYAPWLTTTLLHVLPFYHSANFVAAMKGGTLILPLGAGQTLGLAWQTSALILGAWVGGIGAGTLVGFARQDLN
jgi:ABC-type transport system involved in multi-copper enzyme maturation permease subunit